MVHSYSSPSKCIQLSFCLWCTCLEFQAVIESTLRNIGGGKRGKSPVRCYLQFWFPSLIYLLPLFKKYTPQTAALGLVSRGLVARSGKDEGVCTYSVLTRPQTVGWLLFLRERIVRDSIILSRNGNREFSLILLSFFGG